jgi:hypothetical protein
VKPAPLPPIVALPAVTLNAQALRVLSVALMIVLAAPPVDITVRLTTLIVIGKFVFVLLYVPGYTDIVQFPVELPIASLMGVVLE